MSTKIHNGLKLTNISLLELRDFSARLREKIRPVHEELYGKVIAEICTEIIDTRTLQPDDCKELEEKRYGRTAGMSTPLSIAEFHMRDRQRKIKATQERDPEVDFDCKLCILPIKGTLLAMPFTEQNEFLKVISSMEEVSEYGYCNNSDQPEGISKRSWNSRRDNWNKALPGIGIPSKNGFIIQLTHDDVSIQAEKALPHVKTLEKRARAHAYNTIMGDIIERKKIELGENFSVYHELIEASEYIDTTEGQIELEQKMQEFKLLFKEITIEDLIERG